MSNNQKIIINADDFGLSIGVCKAIDKLAKLGAISETTVMVLVPGIQRCAHKYPYVFDHNMAGVHLVLPGTIPLKDYQRVTSFHIIREETLKKQNVLELDKEIVYNEWDKQIKIFVDYFHHNPTHIDSHMGYHRSEEFRDVYLSLAQKYDIPVRGGESPFSSIMKSYNVKGTTAFVRGWSGKCLSYGDLKVKLLELKAFCDSSCDVIEVTCHPGFVDMTLTMRSHLTFGRKHDYNEVLELHNSMWLEKNGFQLTRFSNL